MCGGPFVEQPRKGLECPEHKTHPHRFFIDLWWKGQQKIYSDGNDQVLSSWDQAYLCLSFINKEIKQEIFDPSKYLKRDKSKFWTSNLLSQFWDFKFPEIAPSYRNNYRVMIEAAKAFFKNQDVREIREMELNFYKRHLENEGKRKKLPQVRWLSQEDQIKLYLLVPDEDKPIIAFMMLHGCRPGEARALRCGDVDLRNQTATIKSTFSGKEIREKRKGKNSKSVIIPIHPECLPFIQQRVKTSLPGAFLFITSKRKAYSVQKLRKVWDKVRAASGVEGLKLYEATRHSVASQLVSAGVSLYQVQQILGHSDSRMTERYAHPDLESIRADLRKLSLKEKVIDLCTGLALEKKL